jgi:hypothetical protein
MATKRPGQGSDKGTSRARNAAPAAAQALRQGTADTEEPEG